MTFSANKNVSLRLFVKESSHDIDMLSSKYLLIYI